MRPYLLLLCLTFDCASISGGMVLAAPPPPWDPDATAPMVHDLAMAAAHARAINCDTPSCKAIIVIDELMSIVQYEDGDANGIASLYLGDRPAVAGRRLDHVLLDHPHLFGPVCATAAKLVSRVHPGLFEIFVPIVLLMNSVDMDIRDHGHCAQTLVTALPRDPDNDQIRLNARRLCINGDENQHRSKTACAVLARGVDERAAIARELDP